MSAEGAEATGGMTEDERAFLWEAIADQHANRRTLYEQMLTLRAEHDALRERVKALAATWERDDEESLNRFGQHLMGGSVLSCAEHLRAALDGPSGAA